MADLDRVVAGLRCREVLAQLSDYLDDDLSADAVRRIHAHLAGCDHCERFGGAFSATVAALRRRLAIPTPVAPDLARQLRERVALGGAGGG